VVPELPLGRPAPLDPHRELRDGRRRPRRSPPALYFKELRVIGSNGLGVEEVGGVAKHAMRHYFDFVAAGLDLTPVITHRFPLERWDEAVLTLKDARRTGAVKVLLEP
jgi:threonine dehydrogenase-like Zn-dependent dehydrogenase